MAFLDDIITKINEDDKDIEKKEPDKKGEAEEKDKESNKKGLLKYSDDFYEHFSS